MKEKREILLESEVFVLFVFSCTTYEEVLEKQERTRAGERSGSENVLEMNIRKPKRQGLGLST